MTWGIKQPDQSSISSRRKRKENALETQEKILPAGIFSEGAGTSFFEQIGVCPDGSDADINTASA